MSESLRYLQIKIGKRKWQFVVLYAKEPSENIVNLLNDDPNQPDLLIVADLDKRLQALWEKSIVSQSLFDWKAQEITNGLSLDPSLSGSCLVVGPQRLLKHFCRSIAPEGETSLKHEIEKKATIPETIPTQLIDLADIPSFPEELRSADPLGQNKQLQNDAQDKLAQFIGVLAKKAHLQGVAITLPAPLSGEVDPDLEPWSRIAHLNLPPDPVNFAALEKQDADVISEDDVFAELTLLQRCLATLSFLSANSMSNNDWFQVAEAFENLGYLFINHQHIETYPGLEQYFAIGTLAAKIHSLNVLHGDFCLSNIRYLPGRPLGERAGTFDLVRNGKSEDHPITALERAKDLALLKLECPFLLWEAIKAGYRFRSPKEAEEVFQLI